MSNFEIAKLFVSILLRTKEETLAQKAWDMIEDRITSSDYVKLAQSLSDEILEVWQLSRELAHSDFCIWVRGHARFKDLDI